MSELELSALTKNAIIRLGGNKEYYCFICTTDSTVENCNEHLGKAEHLEALKQFELIFSNDNGQVHCKFCNADLYWYNMRTHARSHLVIPWYKPEEKFKNCLENRIIAFKTYFYCCSCKMLFFKWSAAFNHSKKPQHRDLHEKLPSIENLLPLPIDIDDELLVHEAFVLFDSNSLICTVCEDEIVEFPNIVDHVKSFLHRHYIDRVKEILKNDYGSLILKDIKEVKTVEVSNLSDSRCDYIEKVDALYSRCVICERQFSTERKKDHSDEKDHANALKQFGCEYVTAKDATHYYCSCCNCTIPGIVNLHLHVKGKRHSSAISKFLKVAPISSDGPEEPEKVAGNCQASIKHPEKSKKSKKNSSVKRNKLKTLNIARNIEKIGITKKMESLEDRKPVAVKKETEKPRVENRVGKISEDYCIRKQAVTDWFCKICDMHFPDCREIEDHVTRTEHEIAMKKYGCENIELLEPNLYNCRCCGCEIAGIQNVCEHVMGKRHSKCMSAGRKADVGHCDKNVAASKSEFSAIVPKATRTKFSKLYLHLRATDGKGIRKRKHIGGSFGKRLPKMRNISCHICRLEVADSADLHSHLANHLSIDFVDQKINENANLRCPSTPRQASEPSENNDERENNSRNVTNDAANIFSKDDDNRRKIEYPPPMDFVLDTSDTDDDSEFAIPPRVSTLRIAAKHLGSKKVDIYDLKERSRIVELGTQLCLIGDKETIYCLVCRKTLANKLQPYFEHLSSLNHTANMDEMEEDDALFDEAIGQFSELQLALEYMQQKSDQLVRCLICNVDIIDDDECLQRHVAKRIHRTTREEMSVCSRKSFEQLKARMHCDWYKVQKYWCVPCSKKYQSEEEFLIHLDHRSHGLSVGEFSLPDKKLIYDFCPTCGLLWYGYRTTYAYHSGLSSHKWLERDGHYSLLELPRLANILLADAESYVEDTLSGIQESLKKDRKKANRLLRKLVKTVKKKFEAVKAYKFGSRVYGVASSESDIDIFLDCGDMYEGKLESTNCMTEFISTVHECLSEEPLLWDVEKLSKNHGVSVLRAHHKATGVSCDIFFENGLPVETTKLLKSINEKFPLCRRMIIFLKQWLMLCDLSGHDKISNYAICWYVIFYLQQESILPSISALMAMKKKPRFIAGWKVNVSHNFTHNKAASDFSLKELLTRFFKYYANFDFRYDVACPLTGEVTKKRLFADLALLPEEMATYVTYMNNSRRAEPLNVDSPICIQDPFELHRNLTETMTKVYLSRFRSYCAKSLDILCSP